MVDIESFSITQLSKSLADSRGAEYSIIVENTALNAGNTNISLGNYTSIEVEYENSDGDTITLPLIRTLLSNRRQITIAYTGGNIISKIRTRLIIPDLDIPKISRVTKLSFVMTNGTEYNIDIINGLASFLVDPNNAQFQSYPDYYRSKTTTIAATQSDADTVTLGVTTNIPLVDFFPVIWDIPNLPNRRFDEFPIRLTSSVGTYEISGHATEDLELDIQIAFIPYTEFGDIIDVDGVVVTGGVPIGLPVTPPPITVQRRMSMSDFELVPPGDHVDGRIIFIPEVTNTELNRIVVYAYDEGNSSNPTQITYNALISNGIYTLANFSDGKKFVYAQADFQTGPSLTTDTYLLNIVNGVLVFNDSQKVAGLANKIKVFTPTVESDSILFKFEDPIFLINNVESVRMRLNGGGESHAFSNIHSRANNYIEVLATGLTASTRYRAFAWITVDSTEAEFLEIDTATIAALPAIPTPEELAKHSIEKIICENLSDQDARAVLVFDDAVLTELAAQIVINKALNPEQSLGVDKNPLNRTTRYGNLPQESSYAVEGTELINDLWSTIISRIPEIDEDIDFITEYN